MTFRSILAVVCVAAVSAGCGRSTLGDNAEPPPEVPRGTLRVAWSIQGAQEAPACSGAGAARASLALYRLNLAPALSVSAECEAFALSTDVAQATYLLDLTLLDDHDVPVSDTVTVRDLKIVADEEVESEIDFPASAIR